MDWEPDETLPCFVNCCDEDAFSWIVIELDGGHRIDVPICNIHATYNLEFYKVTASREHPEKVDS